jgi:hypothetical protein
VDFEDCGICAGKNWAKGPGARRGRELGLPWWGDIRLGEAAMKQLYYQTVYWLQGVWNDSWLWIDRLDRQEWLVLLALVTGLGFLCMRGYSSRMG